MKEYTIAELAYFAGIIDGEGSVTIGKSGKRRSAQGFHYYRTIIEINNTDKRMIDWLTNHIGGRQLEFTPAQTSRNSRLQCYRWVANRDVIEYVLPLALPYIVAKVEQCELVIKMRQTFNYNYHPKKGQQGIPVLDEELMKLRDKLYEDLKLLHCRNYLK